MIAVMEKQDANFSFGFHFMNKEKKFPLKEMYFPRGLHSKRLKWLRIFLIKPNLVPHRKRPFLKYLINLD